MQDILKAKEFLKKETTNATIKHGNNLGCGHFMPRMN
jgi:hypothetical protein